MPKSGLNTSKVSSSAQSIASVSKLRARGEGYVRPLPPSIHFPFLSKFASDWCIKIHGKVPKTLSNRKIQLKDAAFTFRRSYRKEEGGGGVHLTVRGSVITEHYNRKVEVGPNIQSKLSIGVCWMPKGQRIYKDEVSPPEHHGEERLSLVTPRNVSLIRRGSRKFFQGGSNLK